MSATLLVARCGTNDADAWAELMKVAVRSSAGVVRRIVRHHHQDESLADDVLQEVYQYLQADGCRRLVRFSGETMAELGKFLRTILIRSTYRKIRREMRKRQCEATVAANGTVRSEGPTEQKLNTLMAELHAIMSTSDRTKYQNLSAHLSGERAAGGPQPSSRTVRRWQRELYQNYAHKIV